MTLDALYMPMPAGGVRGRIFREEMPPQPRQLTEAQIAQRRAARAKQIGMAKAPNRVMR